MRGKAKLQIIDKNGSGITPAYAGKSLFRQHRPVPAEDHPRLCGEKLSRSAFLFRFPGSPPPMRGKVHFHSDMVSRYRITPAYAGKSFFLHFPFESYKGSPPPMRGKETSWVRPYSENRITPAYAGKRLMKRIQIVFLADHPRLCGEKWVSGFSLTSVSRITPAYAGKSPVSASTFFPIRDHPRLCGEKLT